MKENNDIENEIEGGQDMAGDNLPEDGKNETGGSSSGKENQANAENCSAKKEESPQDKIVSLESKLLEANDQFLRKAAEFENYRKRMIREKQEAVDYANQALLLDLIQVMDDFNMAVNAAKTYFPAGDSEAAGQNAQADGANIPLTVFKTFYEGVSMIEKRLSSQLENKWGLKRFDSLGQPFDPNRHEAIMMDKSPEASEPVVQEEFYKGYTLKDRVVRNAKVKVIMPGAGN